MTYPLARLAPWFFAWLLLPLQGFAQKMLHTDAWRAQHRHCAARPPLNITDSRSDSLDLLHTRIWLDITQAPQVMAHCEISLRPKMQGITQLRFDLQALVVDSVLLDGQPISFERNDPDLRMALPQALPLGDTALLRIVYHGQPASDGSGWGGFYHVGNFSFNLGVGFEADPHSFGRAWFPCFDNFVERSTFHVTVLSPAARPAYCNGLLVSETPLGPNVARSWLLEQPIPSYLAGFAAGPYTTFSRSLNGQLGPIPVQIAAVATDTNKVRNTFARLPLALSAYEQWFGPYRWPKIGYSLVPFNAGAMEHATNVAIGRDYIDGSASYETLWAHELSHHWWGDLATCASAEDMWLNEGWASYAEHLFTEAAYGKAAYRSAVRANFLNVLQTAHVNEGGYRAVSGLPHALTYGAHVYDKGAVVAHNLRGYLGDTLFQRGIRAALDSTLFEAWSSADLRDRMSAATGKDLGPFFENWVFSGGFPDFSVDSFRVQPDGLGQFDLRVFVKQKRRGAPAFFEEVPLEIALLRPDHSRTVQQAVVSGENTVLELKVDYAPAFVFLNPHERITQARTDHEVTLFNAGSPSFSSTKWSMTLNALPDSALFRVEYHFAMPDTGSVANPSGFVLTNRYWTLETDAGPGFDAFATVVYDGRGQQDQLDTELFAATGPSEDSVLVLYRSAVGQP